jgi:hypothetical protein
VLLTKLKSESELRESRNFISLTEQHKSWIPVTFQSKQKYNHDSFVFTFKYLQKQNYYIFEPGESFKFRAWVYQEDMKEDIVMIRNYTPISRQNFLGGFQCLIKIYPKTDSHPGGIFTQYLNTLQ